MINALANILAALPAAVTNDSVARLAEAPPPPAAALGGSGDLFSVLLRMAAALGFVLALVLGAAWAAKRWLPAGTMRAPASDRIDILFSRTLGLRRSLLLARVRGRVLLLGATPQQIACLSEWDETEPWPETGGEPADPHGHSAAVAAFQSLAASRGATGKEKPK